MQKIYINTETRKFYGSDGAQFRDGDPHLAYKRREKIVFQFCSETPNADGVNVRPENWPKSTQFNLPGISALVTVDNDFLRWQQGSLSQDVSSGSISNVSAKIPNVKSGALAEVGTIRLYDALGKAFPLQYEGVVYEAVGVVTFNLVAGSFIDKSFVAGSMIDAPDGMYIQAPMNHAESDPGDGLFVFDVVAYSPKLKAALEYSNKSEVSSLAGMEILLFQTIDDSILELDNFICKTVSVNSTMADANPNAEMPETAKDAQIALIYSQLRLLYAENPVELQFSVDGTSDWHENQTSDDKFYRQRIANIDAEWSEAVMMAPGQKGEPGTNGTDGKDGHTPVRGTDYWTDADKAEIKSYVDEAILNGEW